MTFSGGAEELEDCAGIGAAHLQLNRRRTQIIFHLQLKPVAVMSYGFKGVKFFMGAQSL
jgi:hypothetical protein